MELGTLYINTTKNVTNVFSKHMNVIQFLQINQTIRIGDYRRALYPLHSKLYHDKCEIEVFLDAEISDIYEYDSVRFLLKF